MPKYRYAHGEHNVICDISGFKVKSSETRMTWDGLRVRAEDWDPRHPQDFVRGRPYNQYVSNPRAGATDIELTGTGIEVSVDDL